MNKEKDNFNTSSPCSWAWSSNHEKIFLEVISKGQKQNSSVATNCTEHQYMYRSALCHHNTHIKIHVGESIDSSSCTLDTGGGKINAKNRWRILKLETVSRDSRGAGNLNSLQNRHRFIDRRATLLSERR